MTIQNFKSFLMGGFECSTHRNHAGKRIDVIDSTKHDIFALKDYRRLMEKGILTARDGIRWHLIEKSPGEYDWSSAAAQISAARESGIEIIWDLFHYGYPDDLDIFSAEFIERFAAFAEKFVEFLVRGGTEKPLICLVNEISFFAWAAGEVGFFYPFARGRGNELKKQLIKASLAARAKIKQIAPQAILIQTDPAVRVTPTAPENNLHALDYHAAQYHGLDLLLGKAEPEIGGGENVIDVIGVNYYPYNQWRHPDGERILLGQKDHHPFSKMLKEFYERYDKPLFIAETGTEDDARAEWFGYICEEVKIARRAGVPVLGICLYPIVNHPGWDDDRHCHNGLWDYPDESGEREIYEPLAAEIARQITSGDKARAALKGS